MPAEDGLTATVTATERFQLVLQLRRRKRFAAALREIDGLVRTDPHNLSYLSVQAGLLALLGRYEPAIDIYEAVLARAAANARLWIGYGNALRTVARTADAIAAYRRALQLKPALGEAWWSLANLKTYRFQPAEVDAMTVALGRSDLSAEDRVHLHMALGKAQEDGHRYKVAFDHYAAGNAERWARVRWDGEANHRHVVACERLFTPDFFAAREGGGCKAPDPIFIVGLPRAGSTLIEQILASHSEVEGTMELPEITDMARQLGAGLPGDKPERYLEALSVLPPRELESLGQSYVDRTRVYRQSGRPRFIDKMPNNFNFIALIRLMLPHATIIDARRHPMATCFSAWKQSFLEGQNYSYNLTELGRYYCDYPRFMALFDRVLPGRVLTHRSLPRSVGASTQWHKQYMPLGFTAAR